MLVLESEIHAHPPLLSETLWSIMACTNCLELLYRASRVPNTLDTQIRMASQASTGSVQACVLFHALIIVMLGMTRRLEDDKSHDPVSPMTKVVVSVTEWTGGRGKCNVVKSSTKTAMCNS